MFSVNEILDMAIDIEKKGEAVYRNAIETVAEPNLVALLSWMADEEFKHAEWFSELKKKVEKKMANPFVEEMSREIFADLLGEKSFCHRNVDFSRIENVDDLIAVFIEFEKDTVLFYEILQPFIEDAHTLDSLKKIIAEENRHIEKLRQFVEIVTN